jgi:holliday junction DNA helicase RuvB
MSTQFLAPAVTPDEEDLEQSLRPRRLDEFVGQERIKQQLAIALDAAKGREEALDHVLLVGPPGLGKTSLAYIVREELGVGLRSVAGPALERKGDMAAILTGLERHDVLFVDEIHRLNRAIEEILYPALEDFRLDIVVGQGAAARTLTLDLPPFTLVGATTRTGLLTTPLRDRFGMTFRLDYYEPRDLGLIVRRSARILDVEIEDDAADEIARRSRGTPRIANRILKRVRDVAEVKHDGVITNAVAAEALALLEVDGHGLERIDRELLETILLKFGGGPVGLSTLAVALGEEPGGSWRISAARSSPPPPTRQSCFEPGRVGAGLGGAVARSLRLPRPEADRALHGDAFGGAHARGGRARRRRAARASLALERAGLRILDAGGARGGRRSRRADRPRRFDQAD